jgi:glycosyltransferase involved in cell wall biosynthesis
MMPRERPLVSVIIPVYNCERYLADALESVLGQRHRPIELIVVDDGSIDGSADVARKYADRIRYCYQANRGIGAARNTGVDLATGTYLAFVDADDLWTEDKLERQMEALEACESLDIVFGHVQQFVSPELPDALRRRLRCPSDKMPGRLPGAMLARRDAFFRVGYFSLAIGEAVDWTLRARDRGLKSTVLPDVVLKRRLHATNSALLHRDTQREYVRYLKAALDRRRADNQHA